MRVTKGIKERKKEILQDYKIKHFYSLKNYCRLVPS